MPEIKLPFAGFYESMWSEDLDHAENLEVGGLAEQYELDEGEVGDVVWRHADYHKAHEAIAKAYPESYAAWLADEYGLEIKLTFTLMTSPREYNFTTDRIFADISEADVQVLYDKVGRDAIAKMARKMFTSRDGFMSFYSPDIEEWGPLLEWDYNQLGTILECLDTYDNAMWLSEDLREEVYQAFNACVAWGQVECDLEDLVEAKKAEEEDLPPPEVDTREFPSGTEGVEQYVKSFVELNHLT